MSKKKKAMKPNLPKEVAESKQNERSNSLIFSGVLVAMGSIGLLIFVVSEKVFQLKY